MEKKREEKVCRVGSRREERKCGKRSLDDEGEEKGGGRRKRNQKIIRYNKTTQIFSKIPSTGLPVTFLMMFLTMVLKFILTLTILKNALSQSHF